MDVVHEIHAPGPADRHPASTARGPQVVPAASPSGLTRRPLGPSSLLDIQRSAGNRAAAALATRTTVGTNAAALQRDAATDKKIADLSQRQDVLEKRQASTGLDLEYRGKIGQRLSSYRQATYRLTGGFQAATNSFQAAQRAQAEIDAIKAQLFTMIVSTGAAGMFEPLLKGGLGQLGPKLDKDAAWVEKWAEALENPMNALTSGLGNVGTAAAAAASTEKGQTPGTAGGVQAGDPVSYLAQNLDKIETCTQKFENAFGTRGAAQATTKPEEWLKWSTEAQRAAYDQMLADIDTTLPPTADLLKSQDELAKIVERYMWAAWISTTHVPIVKAYGDSKNRTNAKERRPEDYDSVAMDLGTALEDRLNAVGVSGLAGVTLTGHFYSSNSPSNWRVLLYVWASNYAEKLTTAK